MYQEEFMKNYLVVLVKFHLSPCYCPFISINHSFSPTIAQNCLTMSDDASYSGSTIVSDVTETTTTTSTSTATGTATSASSLSTMIVIDHMDDYDTLFQELNIVREKSISNETNQRIFLGAFMKHCKASGVQSVMGVFSNSCRITDKLSNESLRQLRARIKWMKSNFELRENHKATLLLVKKRLNELNPGGADGDLMNAYAKCADRKRILLERYFELTSELDALRQNISQLEEFDSVTEMSIDHFEMDNNVLNILGLLDKSFELALAFRNVYC